MELCSLDATEQNIPPEIWKNIQSTKGWHDASIIELIKWSNAHQTEESYPVQFHKELVDDIRKLMFSFGASPLADNAHRGISPLAFVLMSVAEENQLRENQEAYDGATSLTPGMMRAAK